MEHACTRLGIDYRALTEGLGELNGTTVPWSVVVTLLEKFQTVVGGPQALEREGFLSNSGPVFAPFRSVVGAFARPRLLYKAVVVWFGPTLVPFIRASYASLPDGRVRIEMTIPDEIEASEAFFRFTLGAYRGLPHALGLGEALVEAKIGPRHASYLILPPPDLTLAARMRRGMLALKGSPQVLDEFGKQQDELRQSYAALLETTKNLEREVAERKRAEGALRQSYDELVTTLNSIGDAVIATDINGRVTRMNPVAEHLTGWTIDAARGKNLSEVFHIVNEETRERVESPVERVLREGAVVGLANHTALLSLDGTPRAIADSGAPIRDAEGNICGVVLVFHDQTEQRRAEREVRQSEARFRRLNESGIIGIVVSNITGHISEANDAFLSLLGYSRAEFEAGEVTAQKINAPEKEQPEVAARMKIKSEGKASPWEKELIHKEGHRVPVLMAVAQLDRSVKEYMTVTLDLSERKRAEAATRESEAHKTAVMEASLDAVVLMDHTGTITEFNAAAERTFGYAREEVIGRLLSEVMIPPAFRSRHSEGLKRYLKTGQAHVVGKRIEVTALRRDGTQFPAEVAIVRIRTSGSPVFTGYIRDISERRQAAEAETLRRAKEAAEAANMELEAFSYSVSHDLRAPLRGIDGFSQALLEDHAHQLDEEGKKHLTRIRAGAQRMGMLIDDLLMLAGVTRSPLRESTVDLSSMACEVADECRQREAHRKVEIVIADELSAQGDARLLRVVLENLFGNAWKFTSKQSQARIEFGKSESVQGRQTFFIKDNGAGFDMSYVNKLFNAFQRLHTSADFPGTGIGLATVQRVIQRHGGKVWAEGSLERGATFFFTL